MCQKFLDSPEWALEVVDEDAESVDIDDVPRCPTCGGWDMWQSVAGDLFGLTPLICYFFSQVASSQTASPIIQPLIRKLLSD